ncbi:MAG: flavin-containing monooxygenase, partial [Mycobacterium sp.]
MTDTHPKTEFDAIVVGAGFGGIYMLHKLRNELGLTARAFDKAGGVGGTWYWNRYPGALSDTESYVYRYSFDKELLQEWDWNTRYLKQPQILSYLEHVVRRHDLGRDIQLNTGVDAAVFDESRDVWEIRTDTGETFTARYLVTALGLLSKTNLPDIKGRDTFQGDLVHTGAWPEKHDLTGKRVGVVGTGSTGQQVTTAIAPEVARLTVFQRSPQYSVPVGNGPVSEEYVASVKDNYDQIWDYVNKSVVAFGFKESEVPAMS